LSYVQKIKDIRWFDMKWQVFYLPKKWQIFFSRHVIVSMLVQTSTKGRGPNEAW
jgi:hypothetical protein